MHINILKANKMASTSPTLSQAPRFRRFVLIKRKLYDVWLINRSELMCNNYYYNYDKFIEMYTDYLKDNK